MTDQPASLAAALADLQQHLPRIGRTAKGQAGTRVYKYAPYDEILRQVRPLLAEHGWLWHTRPTLLNDVGRFVLLYSLTYLPTGEIIAGNYPLTEGPAQKQGADISYAKRYALVAVLDLEVVGEDVDGMERTPAKIPGPEHERLRYGTVENTPDDRPATRQRGPVDNDPVDKWTDQPPGNFDIGTPEDHPGSIDPRGAQMKALQAKFRELGIDDRGVRLGMVSDWLGRSVLSANQLSRIEAAEVIRQLDKRLAAEEAGA